MGCGTARYGGVRYGMAWLGVQLLLSRYKVGFGLVWRGPVGFGTTFG